MSTCQRTSTTGSSTRSSAVPDGSRNVRRCVILLLGEIKTCLLHHSTSLDSASVAALLALVPGERVRSSQRPIAHAISPTRLTAVDCPLPTGSRSRCAGVGTVSTHAVVTGGRTLQGSATVRIERGSADHRQPWSHYLARPGVVETVGKLADDDVAAGFLTEHAPSTSIDLGAIAEQQISDVQLTSRLDHRTPLRAQRTRLRWAASTATGRAPRGAEFTIVDDTVRTLRVEVREQDLADVLGFCENLALHDWVLTTLLTIVDRSRLGAADLTAFDRLQPAVDHLLHLWMPGAHVAPTMTPLWESLEQRPGFTRQWAATVNRIRDQLALHTLSTLRDRELVEHATTDK